MVELENVREIKEGNIPCVVFKTPLYFDVEKIFDCGQCFRFDRVEKTEHKSEFSGVAMGRYVSFAEDDKETYIYNSTEQEFFNIWSRYLSLDMDYEAVERDIFENCKNPILREAAEYGRGIRILRQDSFESIISFIISQNNNIPRIKKIIERLSKESGNEIEVGGMEKHCTEVSSRFSFPTADAIYSLGIDGLRGIGTGFRAKYIYDAVEKMLSGELDISKIALAENTETGIDMLCSVKGIGPKVASCALLFGFERYDAFPIDVWMKRAVEKYFPEYDKDSFSPTILGQYAGIAQQYLFYYERYLGGKEI
ncbi:MAG: DNA-3-methyladenine glycosylase 2 family protein [Clostridia bacterium]|nr:DNA-3-methyladenine glycosylase 2 family protein [Clostridia bacterium]